MGKNKCSWQMPKNTLTPLHSTFVGEDDMNAIAKL